MVKRFLLFLVVLNFLLSGCAKADYKVSINEDGSANLSYRLELEKLKEGNKVLDYGIDTTVLGDLGVDELLAQAQAKKFKVEKFDGAKVGFLAEKHISDFRELLKSQQDLPFDFPKGFWLSKQGLLYEEGLFFNTYSYNAKLDWSVLGIGDKKQKANQESDDNNPFSFTEIILEEPVAPEDIGIVKPIFNLTISLPTEVNEHNATLVDNSSKTLIWEIVPGETKEITFTAKELNIYSVSYLILLVTGFILIAGGVFFLTGKK